MKNGEQLWETLFKLAPIRRAEPLSTLYGVIQDTRDLDTVKRFVAGGHEIEQQFGGGHSVLLAISKGDLPFVRYFVEHAAYLESLHELLAAGVKRLADCAPEDADNAREVFDYLLTLKPARAQLKSAYLRAAAEHQFGAACAILDAGLEDDEMRVGEDRERVLLSDWLVQSGYDDFADMLKGEPVDSDRLEQREQRERKKKARRNSAFDGPTVFSDHDVLQGDEFEQCYQSVVAAVRNGECGEALAESNSRFGGSPIEFAATHGFVELVEAIVDSDPVDREYAEHARNAAAIAAATWGHLDVLQLLKDRGVSIEATPQGRNSPLSEACRFGQYDVVRYLLELGAEPSASDGSGHEPTLLSLAGGEQRSRIIELLEEYSANDP